MFRGMFIFSKLLLNVITIIYIISLGLKVDAQIEICSPRSFHISQVAFDLNSSGDDNEQTTQLWVVVNEFEYLLASLNVAIPQVKNEKVTFHAVGAGSLYLSGYYIPEDNPYQEQVREKVALLIIFAVLNINKILYFTF